jgi:SOS-response transcriptional repressor LexA
MARKWAEFGRWLGNEIDKRDWRPADFAREVGASPQNVSRWVGGKVQPTTQSARLIARALEIPEDDVLVRAGHRATSGGAVERRSPVDNLRSLVREMPISVPVRDHPVSAGRGVPAVQEFMYLPPGTAIGPGWYCLPVQGTCMVPRLNPGDLVLVNPDGMPDPGDMVVVDIDHEAALVKWFVRRKDGYYLQPEQGEPIPYDEEHVRLVGVVMGTFGKKPRRGRA